VAVILASGAGLVRAQAPAPSQVLVAEERGVYSVKATFTVPQSAETVLAVLTDYAAIPQFMPQVRTSIVREQAAGRVVVEQEAVARFLMFSRRIHLILQVNEAPSAITFADLCGRSFHQYAGTWEFERVNGLTRVRYTLTAKPAFAVPELLLGRLLKRDANQMVAGLQREIARREPAAPGTTWTAAGTTDDRHAEAR
jgi:ribosome-associated toxin RatA of RatAB toxin-antitoxin module